MKRSLALPPQPPSGLRANSPVAQVTALPTLRQKGLKIDDVPRDAIGNIDGNELWLAVAALCGVDTATVDHMRLWPDDWKTRQVIGRVTEGWWRRQTGRFLFGNIRGYCINAQTGDLGARQTLSKLLGFSISELWPDRSAPALAPASDATKPEALIDRVLGFVRSFATERGYSPTWEEIGTGVGITQFELMPLIKRLVADGLLHRTRAKRRMLAFGPPRLDCVPKSELIAELNRRRRK